MMANMMGSYGFWVKDGAVQEKGLVSLISHVLQQMLIPDMKQFVRLERNLASFLTRRGYAPPFPQSHFE
jgi:phosphatidylglycerophosphatase GEP4